VRKREIRQLVESTGDPAFVVDGMHNIVFWNEAAESCFGINSEEAVGKSCANVVQGYDECGKFCSSDCCVFDAAEKRRNIRNFDLQVHARDLKQWFNVSVLIVNDDESTYPSTLHIFRQIDTRKRLEVLVRDFVARETGLSGEQARKISAVSRNPTRETSLTDREAEILRHLAGGKTSKEISEKLSISRSTVNNHVQHILKKLGAHTRLEAIRRAENSGLI